MGLDGTRVLFDASLASSDRNRMTSDARSHRTCRAPQRCAGSASAMSTEATFRPDWASVMGQASGSFSSASPSFQAEVNNVRRIPAAGGRDVLGLCIIK